jgi:RNA polymerase sigma factor (sigma-70 family)
LVACGVVLDRGVSKRFREGDPDAVRDVYRAYGGLVYAVAHRVLGISALAEEAVQQTFVNAWRAAASFDESRDIGPWLAVIARRVAIDIHRREAARSAEPLDTAPAGDSALVTQATSAEAIYDVWEVRRAVTELPADEQEIVRLQHFEGLTHTEIAERTGVAVGTVKSRSFRAHKRLAGLLGHLRD